MGIVFKNNAKTTLGSSLTNSATSATVTDGSVFPSLAAGEFFFCTFDDGTNNEIVKVTARSSNTLTIVRAQESTTARAFSSGDAAELRLTAGVLETIQENIAAKSANQTVFNATTSGGATSYDIGIDPGVEGNAMVFLNGVLQHHNTISFSSSTLTFDAAPPNGMALEVIVDNLINLQSSNLTVDSFTAADVGGSAQTDFTLSDTPAAETNLIVFVDGVFQDQDAYTISNNTLTITTGVIAGRGVTVYVINPVNIGTPSDGTITSAKLSGNITMPGTLTVGSNDVAFDSPTFVVDNSNSRVGLGTASPSVPVDIVGDVKMSANLTVDTSTLKVDSSNNRVGIGDASPDNTLHVNSGTSNVVAKFESTDSIAAIQLKDNNGEAEIGNVGNDIGFFPAGAEKVRITSAGNLLVGATSFNAGAFGSASGINVAGTQPLVLVHETDTDKDGFMGISASVMFLGTADAIPLRFSTNDAERMRIDSSGNVGIGTDSPTLVAGKIVHIHGTAAGVHLTDTASGTTNADGAYVAFDNPSLFIQNKEAGSTIFETSGTERMRIDSSGNVGIGSSTINAKLNVHGTIRAENDKFLAGRKDAATPAYSFHDDGDTGIFNVNSNILGFSTAGSERMRIDSSGHVGIGAAPSTTGFGGTYKYLGVQGGSGYGVFNGQTTSTSVNDGAASFFGSTVGTSGFALLGGMQVVNIASSASNAEGGLLFYTGSGGSIPERMRIDNSGRVSIGTTSALGNLTIGGNSSSARVLPATDNVGYIGESVHRWQAIYAVTGSIQTSDEREKTEIKETTLGLNFIKDLKPVSYKWIDGEQQNKGKDEREHQGLIAQQVAETVEKHGVNKNDFGGLDIQKTEKYEDFHGMSYNQFVAPLIKAIQEQQAVIEDLKTRIETLEG